MSGIVEVFRGRPEINAEKCDGCGACAALCPSMAMRVVDEEKKRRIELSLANCIFCGRCSEICPKDAITLANKPEHPSPTLILVKEVEVDLLRCERCNSVIAPLREISKIDEIKEVLKLSNEFVKRNKLYCDRCKRLMTSRTLTHVI